ncbi:MAG: hypothetical protein AUI15_39390 [Actinobacteria bacterium 13_2_20CM_2_66_6]|nr:MAG: hypothetical protein AUI15_39390 [Actinobacteria bacterium 13_2_20CM_2_66_6]
MMLTAHILLHGFGPRYDLPIATALYLYAAGGVVFISFVLVVLFAGDRVGPNATDYPRRAVPWLLPVARSPWPRIVGGGIGLVGFLTVVIAGFFGSDNSFYNPAEYVVWIFFWAMLVILSGLVGNLWYLLNPWTAIYDAVARLARIKAAWKLPEVGIWPATAAYFSFACLELTTGMANRPVIVAIAALVYTVITVAGMLLFGRDEWLEHCEAFTILFGIVARFGPVEAERDEWGRISAVYVRPWGVGLLKPAPSGWDRVLFVILMLSTLAFDGISATPAWQDFTVSLKPFWLPLGSFGFFAIRTFGLILLTIAFLLVFITFMEAVIYLGQREVDLKATVSSFALTLVPIALVYNAAHNYSYVVVSSQYMIPLLNDPLHRGWHLLPAVASFSPNFALAQASTVWYADIVLIVLGHVIAVFLSHLRAGERFRTAQRALLSQYPMLLLMVLYTMTSLWILAQPITRES